MRAFARLTPIPPFPLGGGRSVAVAGESRTADAIRGRNFGTTWQTLA